MPIIFLIDLADLRAREFTLRVAAAIYVCEVHKCGRLDNDALNCGAEVSFLWLSETVGPCMRNNR